MTKYYLKKIKILIIIIFITLLSSCNKPKNTNIESKNAMYITVTKDNNISEKIKIDLVNNSTTKALIEKLKQGDISYVATDYGNFEKVGNIGFYLPQNDVMMSTSIGDIVLYNGNNIVIFYGNNSWNYTKIGKITTLSDEEIKKLLYSGQGEIIINLSISS